MNAAKMVSRAVLWARCRHPCRACGRYPSRTRQLPIQPLMTQWHCEVARSRLVVPAPPPFHIMIEHSSSTSSTTIQRTTCVQYSWQHQMIPPRHQVALVIGPPRTPKPCAYPFHTVLGNNRILRVALSEVTDCAACRPATSCFRRSSSLGALLGWTSAPTSTTTSRSLRRRARSRRS